MSGGADRRAEGPIRKDERPEVRTRHERLWSRRPRRTSRPPEQQLETHQRASNDGAASCEPRQANLPGFVFGWSSGFSLRRLRSTLLDVNLPRLKPELQQLAEFCVC